MKKYLAIIALAAACAVPAHAGDDYYLERVRQQLQLDEIQRQTREIRDQLRAQENDREARAIMRSSDPMQAMIESKFFGVRHY